MRVILLARKTPDVSLGHSIIGYGVSGLNIDESRIPITNGEKNPTTYRRSGSIAQCTPGKYSDYRWVNRIRPETYQAVHPGEAFGRWPSNLIIGTQIVVDELNSQSGDRPSSRVNPETKVHGDRGDIFKMSSSKTHTGFDDSGTVVRYFKQFGLGRT